MEFPLWYKKEEEEEKKKTALRIHIWALKLWASWENREACFLLSTCRADRYHSSFILVGGHRSTATRYLSQLGNIPPTPPHPKIIIIIMVLLYRIPCTIQREHLYISLSVLSPLAHTLITDNIQKRHYYQIYPVLPSPSPLTWVILRKLGSLQLVVFVWGAGFAVCVRKRRGQVCWTFVTDSEVIQGIVLSIVSVCSDVKEIRQGKR